ncbi:MAG: hypothetical protein QM811_16805 [Pirellulales bacterium]
MRERQAAGPRTRPQRVLQRRSAFVRLDAVVPVRADVAGRILDPIAFDPLDAAVGETQHAEVAVEHRTLFGDPQKRGQTMTAGPIETSLLRTLLEQRRNLVVEVFPGLILLRAVAAVKPKRRDVVQVPADRPGGDRVVASKVARVGDQLLTLAAVEDPVFARRRDLRRAATIFVFDGVVEEFLRRRRRIAQTGLVDVDASGEGKHERQREEH